MQLKAIHCHSIEIWRLTGILHLFFFGSYNSKRFFKNNYLIYYIFCVYNITWIILFAESLINIDIKTAENHVKPWILKKTYIDYNFMVFSCVNNSNLRYKDIILKLIISNVFKRCYCKWLRISFWVCTYAMSGWSYYKSKHFIQKLFFSNFFLCFACIMNKFVT